MQIRNYVKQRKISLTLSKKIKISIAQKHKLEQKFEKISQIEKTEQEQATKFQSEGAGRDRVLMGATKRDGN